MTTEAHNDENAANMVKVDVLAENKQRRLPVNAWKPGQSGNPNGRPKKAQELAILDAITAAFTPEQITEHLHQAMQIALEKKSARGIVAVLEFMADRTIGKPIQRVEQTGGGLADVLAMLDAE